MSRLAAYTPPAPADMRVALADHYGELSLSHPSKAMRDLYAARASALADGLPYLAREYELSLVCPRGTGYEATGSREFTITADGDVQLHR